MERKIYYFKGGFSNTNCIQKLIDLGYKNENFYVGDSNTNLYYNKYDDTIGQVDIDSEIGKLVLAFGEDIGNKYPISYHDIEGDLKTTCDIIIEGISNSNIGTMHNHIAAKVINFVKLLCIMNAYNVKFNNNHRNISFINIDKDVDNRQEFYAKFKRKINSIFN